MFHFDKEHSVHNSKMALYFKLVFYVHKMKANEAYYTYLLHAL